MQELLNQSTIVRVGSYNNYIEAKRLYRDRRFRFFYKKLH
jgi:hypothetical protein